MGITIKRARGRRIAYIIALAELCNIPCVSRLICTDIVQQDQDEGLRSNAQVVLAKL